MSVESTHSIKTCLIVKGQLHGIHSFKSPDQHVFSPDRSSTASAKGKFFAKIPRGDPGV